MKHKLLYCLFSFGILSAFQVRSQTGLDAYFERLSPAQPAIRLGGRTTFFAVNPGNQNEVIAASGSGGLMKTVDGGLHWRTVFSLPPHLITSVQYAPRNTNYIIATALDYFSLVPRGGIWLSRNGGDSWEQPSGCIPIGLPAGAGLIGYNLATFPGSNRIIAGTNYGVAISDDNGITWTYQNVPGTTAYAVALLQNNAMVIGTNSGIYFLSGTGASWTQETTGIGTAYGSNSLHVPKQFMNDVTTSAPVFVTTSSGLIMLSNTGGRTWMRVDTLPTPIPDDANGTFFVRMATAGLTLGAPGLDLYASNHLNIYRKYCRRTGSNFSYDFTGPWVLINTQHADISDLSLDRDGNPYFLGGDGGVQKFWRNVTGDNFSFDGGGYSANGYHGLQITEVSGMHITSRGNTDIYFGTQDNNLYASGNGGSAWNHSTPSEGFLLEHASRVREDAEAELAFVSCGACGNRFSGRLFSSLTSAIPPPVPNSVTLKYLNTKAWLTFAYPDNTSAPGTMGSTSFWYTSDYTIRSGVAPSWTLMNTQPNFVPRGIARKSGSGSEQVLYQAFKAFSDAGDDVGGTDGSGIQRVKLMRMRVTMGPGSSFTSEPLYPAMRNFGSIGVFPTEFAWYEMFAANPVNPQHLIAADALNNKMMQSFNGGDDWIQMNRLTDLVTGSGAFRFKMGRQTNVSCIGFNPEYPRLVLVGTRNAGIFYSWNSGASWEMVPGSRLIPEVSSFYFEKPNVAWISSYGRGLWTLEFTLRARRNLFTNACGAGQCDFLFAPGSLDRMTAGNDNKMPIDYDRGMMVSGGKISGMRVNNGIVESVEYSPDATVIWYTDEKDVKAPVKTEIYDQATSTGFNGIDKINEIIKQGYLIKGVLLKENRLVDIVYGKEPFQIPDDIKKEPYVAVGAKSLDWQGKPFILLSSDKMLNGYCTVLSGEKLILRGNNFDMSGTLPLEVFIDGKPSLTIKLEKLETDGNFTTAFIADFTKGYHTITVNQYKSGKRVISQTDEFMVTHEDHTMEEKKDDPQQPKKEDAKKEELKKEELKKDEIKKEPVKNEPPSKEKAVELKDKIEKVIPQTKKQ